MAYLELEAVQAWLNQSKYGISINDLDPQLEKTAFDTVSTPLSSRYDTSTWVDGTTTPDLVLNMMAMLVASYILRKAISEDDGEHDYPDWLERRVLQMVEAIVGKQLDIPGVDPDPNDALNLVPDFFPTDASTQFWKDDPLAEVLAHSPSRWR